MTHGKGWTFSTHFSSLALTVRDRQCLEDSEQQDDSLNEWINYEGVCRKAPATQGLLNITLARADLEKDNCLHNLVFKLNYCIWKHMLLVQKNARNLIMKEEEYNVNKTAKTN